ncbi:Cullin-domain-containing protein [Guyanagaster necrorhizus]|uniref:Cullin-domain-containing protein n=1 Tax=Guyanagaster necrorhizus TaxID=856835 RepID=A0A9P8AMK8_9AGAR|nr:Cullin-domain-containing protein [Guyanagaster necrorhizus MCA 3950]KAG7440796.1 Cullin-domain-containing protein [Guyanagaster necrorhizus MCA 3950]
MASSNSFPSLPSRTSDLATVWAFLEEGLDAIMTALLNAAVFNYYMSSNDRFRGSSSGLYDKFRKYLRVRLKTIWNVHCLLCLLTVGSLQGEELLRYYGTEWRRYEIRVRFMDRKLALVQWKAKVLDPINQKKCLDIYENDFEAPFFVATEMYYKGEAETFLAAARESNFSYFKKVQDRLNEEKNRIEQEENFPASLSRTQGQDLLRKKFEWQGKKAVLDAGPRLVATDSEPDPKRYLDALLEVHTKYSKIMTQCLYGDIGFIGSLRNLYHFCKPKCCDGDYEQSVTPTELDRRNGYKDIFLNFFYAARLSKRIIYGLSASDERETSMISKLRNACGSEYTSKLRQMSMDAKVSKDLTEQFKDVSFSVMVLGSNAWPLSRSSHGFTIPKETYPTYEHFQKYYRTKYSRRKLTWLWTYSRNELRVNYLDQRYILITSSYQMAILVLYNNHTLLSVSELVMATSIPKEIVIQVLAILAKARILYGLNSNFKSKIRINVNQLIKAEGQTDDRKHILQVIIVRIMKARKLMTNQ